MTFDLVVEPSAKRDIADADAYYAQFGKAEAFLAAIDHVFERLANRPLIFPVVYYGRSSRAASQVDDAACYHGRRASR